MMIKIIKNNQEYQEALKLISELMDKNPQPNSTEGEQLELLTMLVENYEKNVIGETLPDPIDALIFRMEQENLTPDDLVPYIGSRSKVSEVLSRKRPLSINMMKSLQDGLGIPAKVLLNQQRSLNAIDFDLGKFPIKEMIKRGYILENGVKTIGDQLKDFFNQIKGNENVFALLSKTFYIRSPRPMNQYALLTWVARIVNKTKSKKFGIEFKDGSLNSDFLRKIIDLSDEQDGIYRAIDLLESVGISVIIEPHMPQTYLDGASIMTNKKNPIIGMTVRHDRLDNFWFTLLHEIAHIALHYGKGTSLFYDDIESVDLSDPREKEADEMALNVMIPEEKWKNSPASILPSPDAAILLAQELSIHPSIIAGKMRYQKKHYHLLNSLIGKGEVRKLFPDINWPK